MLVHSYVAVEGVELTVYKESVVVKKVKEVGLRSRRAQLFMTEIIIELGYSHAPSRLPVKKLRRLLHKRRKVRVFVWKGIRKNIISYYSSAFTINPQPRRRSVQAMELLNVSIQYCSVTKYFDGLLTLLNMSSLAKNCTLLVHNFFQRKMKRYSKRVFFKFYVLLSKNS